MTLAPLLRPDQLALAVDLYELTMLQAYVAEGLEQRPAVFSLFFRELPAGRNFMVACGQEAIARRLPELHFSAAAREALKSVEVLSPGFVDWLADFRFTGHVHAVPEGTPVFALEPILEVEAPLGQAQFLETLLMNQVHVETVLASKAARVALAAAGRPVVDFSMRRAHGIDAAVHGTRAFRIGGIDATSNVLGGLMHDVAVSGTMAHSFVQIFDSEPDAFDAFWRSMRDPTLLVDTYDTVGGVCNAIRAARHHDRPPRAIRLDSGDLAELSRAARVLLDEAGLTSVRIVASGGLDEFRIRDLLAGEAPIDGFGVGTEIGVSRDAPALELVYKLTEFDGHPRAKLSTGKAMLPGRKQVFRRRDAGGQILGDVLAHRDESAPGEPLLRQVVRGGLPLESAMLSLEQARAHCAASVAALPARLRALEVAEEPFPVEVSGCLQALQDEIRRDHPAAST